MDTLTFQVGGLPNVERIDVQVIPHQHAPTLRAPHRAARATAMHFLHTAAFYTAPRMRRDAPLRAGTNASYRPANCHTGLATRF